MNIFTIFAVFVCLHGYSIMCLESTFLDQQQDEIEAEVYIEDEDDGDGNEPGVEAKSYAGYLVIDINPESKTQLDGLVQLMNNNPELDFWEEPRVVGRRVRILLHEDHMRRLVLPYFQSAGITYTVSNGDVQSTVDAERDRLTKRGRSANTFDVNDFNTLKQINRWLRRQKRNCPSGLICKRRLIGHSHEGRPIYAFMVTGETSDNLLERKSIYIDSTTHAREWLSTATNLKLLDNFIKGWASEEGTVMDLLNRYKWHFVVVVNPDGYRYSWTTNRYWRKNRSPTNSGCMGVDLNRNFDYNWSRQGVSMNPCDEIYCGTSGNSEPETRAVTGYLSRVAGPDGSRLLAAVTLHSYGKYWLIPFGFTDNFQQSGTCQTPPDFVHVNTVAEAACSAIQSYSGNTWTCGNSCSIFYATTGTTDDWIVGSLNVKYVYNPELRGDDFVVPASEIEPSFQEIWAAIKAMMNAIEGIEGV